MNRQSYQDLSLIISRNLHVAIRHLLPFFKARSCLFEWLFLISAFTSLLFYSVIVLTCSVNVPVGDDYAMLGFLNQFRSLHGLGDKLDLLFSFHNEHRIVITRILMLLSSQLTGGIDFRVLNLIGNGALFLALLAVGSLLRFKEGWKWAVLFLVALLPQPLKLMFYPMAGVQAYFGLLFFILYLQFSLKDSTGGVLAFSCTFLLAVLTSGSGIFLALIGVPMLLCKRHFMRAAIHAVLAAVVVVLYLYRFPEDSPSSSLSYIVEHLWSVGKFYLLLLGNVAEFPMMSSPFMQMLCGAGFLICFAYFAWDGLLHPSRTSSGQSHLVELSFMLYLLMMVGLIAAGRAEIYRENLAGMSLDGRYRIYSMLFLAVLLINLMSRACDGGHRVTLCIGLPGGVVALAMLFNLLWSVPSLSQMRLTAVQRVEAMRHWQDSGDISVLPIWATPPEQAKANLELAVKTGTYHFSGGQFKH